MYISVVYVYIGLLTVNVAAQHRMDEYKSMLCISPVATSDVSALMQDSVWTLKYFVIVYLLEFKFDLHTKYLIL